MLFKCYCYFYGHGTRERLVVDIPEGRGVADIKDGFWISKDLKWCVLSDVEYYIPPSQILLIKHREE